MEGLLPLAGGGRSAWSWHVGCAAWWAALEEGSSQQAMQTEAGGAPHPGWGLCAWG